VVGSSSTLTASVQLFNGASMPTSYGWDCDGNGTIDTTTAGQSATCAYGTVGTITSRVVATDGTTTGSTTVAVTVTALPVPSYTVALAASPASVVFGDSAVLTASVTQVNAPPPTSFAWDCNGDGIVDFTGATNTHSCVYSTAGTVVSKVTVSSNIATGSATAAVTVASQAALFVGITAPTLTPSLAGGGTVTFTATVTSNGPVPASFQWQWDDTNDGVYDITIASAPNGNIRTTSYGSIGAKTVKVRVFDSVTGREATGLLTITVGP
jgi:PKD repeat protein